MKKILLFLLIILPVYLVVSLYFLDKEYFICPIDYEKDILIRCDDRGDGFFAANRKGNRVHEGIDLFAEIGTPVKSARSGKVVGADKNRGMGNYVIIKHPGRVVTVYGHLSQIYVTKNQFVRQRDIIGTVGKTGNADSLAIKPHLHFEVRKDGIAQDPLEYLQ